MSAKYMNLLFTDLVGFYVSATFSLLWLCFNNSSYVQETSLSCLLGWTSKICFILNRGTLLWQLEQFKNNSRLGSCWEWPRLPLQTAFSCDSWSSCQLCGPQRHSTFQCLEEQMNEDLGLCMVWVMGHPAVVKSGEQHGRHRKGGVKGDLYQALFTPPLTLSLSSTTMPWLIYLKLQPLLSSSSFSVYTFHYFLPIWDETKLALHHQTF